MSKEITFEVMYSSEYGGTGTDGIEIISDRGTFALQWKELTDQPALSTPKFDPDTEMIVRKDFKSRRTGGNEYTVDSVKKDDGKILIYYSVKHEGLYATDAITDPVILLKIKKIEDSEPEFIINTNN